MDTKQQAHAHRPSVTVTLLPLAVKTLVIDGKRLTSAFFRQIREQDLLNERTGEVEGIPLGYVNVHQRETCPQCPHRHVLWMHEEKQLLRHAVLVEPEDAEYYQDLKEKSKQKREGLMDLLALLLVSIHRTPDHTYWDGRGYRQDGARTSLTIAGEKLSVSASVSRTLADLEKARLCLDQAHPGREDESQNSSLTLSSHDLDTARFLRRQIAQEGILLTHPALYKLQSYDHEEDALVRLNSYSSSTGQRTQHTRSVKDNWFIYTNAESQVSSSQSQEQLYWRSTRHASDTITDEQAEAVEAKLLPSIRALRFLIAEQITHDQFKKVGAQVNVLAQEFGLPVPIEGKWQASLPLVRDASAEERRQFQNYTMRWKESLATLKTLEQLYIV